MAHQCAHRCSSIPTQAATHHRRKIVPAMIPASTTHDTYCAVFHSDDPHRAQQKCCARLNPLTDDVQGHVQQNSRPHSLQLMRPFELQLLINSILAVPKVTSEGTSTTSMITQAQRIALKALNPPEQLSCSRNR
jgi:hypothetical protein